MELEDLETVGPQSDGSGDNNTADLESVTAASVVSGVAAINTSVSGEAGCGPVRAIAAFPKLTHAPDLQAVVAAAAREGGGGGGGGTESFTKSDIHGHMVTKSDIHGHKHY